MKCNKGCTKNERNEEKREANNTYFLVVVVIVVVVVVVETIHQITRDSFSFVAASAVSRSVDRPAGRSVGRLVDWLVCWGCVALVCVSAVRIYMCMLACGLI